MSQQPLFIELAKIFTEKMPYARLFNLQTLHCDHKEVILRFAMQTQFIGNYVCNMLHGGVSASILDTAGGLSAIAAAIVKLKVTSREQAIKQLTKARTIDFRIDYLRPGQGDYFTAKAKPIRVGTRISTIAMQLSNDKDVLIAIATATYMIGH